MNKIHQSESRVSDTQRPQSRVSRREFFRTAAVAGVGIGLGVATIANAQEETWDAETDVVVVGSGGAALSGAVGAIQNGARVMIFEKGPVIGGTTAKSGGVFWICNNFHMEALGLDDPKEDALKYMARLAYPHLYRAGSPTLGLSQHAYDLLDTFYEEGSRIALTLNDTGALVSRTQMSWTGKPGPDYQAELAENKAPRGRATIPTNAEGGPGFGVDMIRQLSAVATSHGFPILTEHQVTRILINEDREVIGVEVASPDGPMRVRALKGVIFGSGGFTQNPEMRTSYLRHPVLGGCAVPTNQGDFVNMAIEIGAKLGNMNESWLQQEVLEEVLQFTSVPSGAFLLGGDSMIVVNKYGSRLYSEKYVYNERTRTHVNWDTKLTDYSNLYQFMIFDDHARAYGGALMPRPDADLPAHVIKSDTLDGLATAIQDRLDALADRAGDFKLAEEFLPGLKETIARFNGFAETGKDLDFHRGETPIEESFHRPGANNDKPNKWLYPISETGPYYAIILAPGTLDTKGGAETNTHGQVLDVHDRPITGLYAAGNCASSISGQAYWGAGGTLGVAVTFGYLAGEHAARRS